MLRLYKEIVGANRDPQVAVTPYLEGFVEDNAMFLVGMAGQVFDKSEVVEYYIANDSKEVNYEEIQIVSQDQDMSDGNNENDFIQYRVLHEYLNAVGSPEAIWSPWMTTLTIDDTLPQKDLAGRVISVSPRVLTYYAETNTMSQKRDIIFVQLRFKVPLVLSTQLKDDLVPTIIPTHTLNTNGGRP